MGISNYIKGLREKIGNDLLLLPSVSAIIVDERGWVLLQRAVNLGAEMNKKAVEEVARVTA